MSLRQKQQQMPLEFHETLVDVICLWQWLAPKLSGLISAEYLDKLREMFDGGSLGCLLEVLGVKTRQVPGEGTGF